MYWTPQQRDVVKSNDFWANESEKLGLSIRKVSRDTGEALCSQDLAPE
jgi:hypothetical protein